MKRTKTWILVADGSQGRILFNDGPGLGLQPVPDSEFAAAIQPDRDVNSDRPGRTFDSAGAGRHAMEPPSSPQRQQKRALARRFVDRLSREHQAGAFDRLIIIASPQMLGDLRSLLPSGLTACVAGEIDKDLTRVPEQELAGHLEHLLAV